MVSILLATVFVDLSNPANVLATFYGAASYYYTGWNVVQGDFNGDGYDDLAFCGLYSSAAYIVFGNSGFGGDYYMNSGADVVISTYPYQVASLAVGDFNGDGYDDLLMGLPDSAYYSWRGAALVFYGRSSWPSSLGMSDADVAIYDTVTGSGSGDAAGDLGTCVAAGDVNGDGYDDLIIQAAGENPFGRVDAGVVYLFYGGSLSSAYTVPGGEDARFAAPDAGDMLYWDGSQFYFVDNTLASADLNGDGKDEIILGLGWADGPSNSRSDAGEVHVIFGGSYSGDYDLASLSHTVVYGAEAGDMLSALGVLGDLNSDSFDDLIVGAFYGDGPSNSRTDAGEVYLLWGRSTWNSSYDMLSDYDVVAWGAETGDYLTVGSVGDFSGDGQPDLLLVAYGADGPGNTRANCGEAYVFSGSSVAGQIDLAVDSPLVLVCGAQSNDWLGAACDIFVSDPNGNGKPNLVIDATYSSRLGYSYNGQVFVVKWPEALFVGAEESGKGEFPCVVRTAMGGARLLLRKPGTVEVFTSSGRIVYARRLPAGSFFVPLAPGAYFVRFEGKPAGKALVAR